jgi:hypothetical protein
MNPVATLITLLTFTTLASAEVENIGKWTLDTRSPGFAEAYTSNDSGSVLGMICAPKCFTYLDAGLKCKQGATYPVLYSAASGVGVKEGVCIHMKDRQFLRLEDAKFIVENSESGALMGFSIGMPNARFKVIKFNMEGAHNAIQGFLAHLLDNAESKSPSKTTDKIY